MKTEVTELPLKILLQALLLLLLFCENSKNSAIYKLYCTVLLLSLFEYSRIFDFEILKNFYSLENDPMNELGFRKSRNGFTSGFTSGPIEK